MTKTVDSPAPTVPKRTPALGKSATTNQGTGKALHYGSTDKKVRWLLCGSVITTSSLVSAGKDLTAVAAAGRGSTAAGTSGGIHVMGQDLNDAEDLEPLASRYAGYKGKPLLPAKSTAGTGRKFVPRDAALRSSGEEGLKGVDEDLEGLPFLLSSSEDDDSSSDSEFDDSSSDSEFEADASRGYPPSLISSGPVKQGAIGQDTLAGRDEVPPPTTPTQCKIKQSIKSEIIQQSILVHLP